MLVLGIDPGTEKMGYAIISATPELKTLEASGVIETPAKITINDRMFIMTDSLEKILTIILNSCKKPIVFSAIENQFKGKNIKTTINLARSSGMIIEMIYKITNTKPFIFEPSEWMSEMELKTKQSCPQRDQELKDIIRSRYNKDVTSIDECCAIGIATKLANLCKN